MSNPIQNAMNASRKVHKGLGGVSITITRGVTTSGAIVATVGFSGETVYEDNGSSTYTKHRDYLIDVSEYALVSGTPLLPERHDIITESVNGVVSEFEVVSSTSDGVSNYDDKDRIWWRVHTKEK
jgi:hypothetical protein